jgi:hypothetical protein
MLTLWNRSRERVRKDSNRVGAKRKLWRGVRKLVYWGGGKSVLLLESSQVVLARPFDRDWVRMQTVRLVSRKAWDRDGGILIFLLTIAHMKIWTFNDFSDLRIRGVILMNLKSGGLHDKHTVATSNLRTISVFLKTEENQENLCRNSQSKDVLDAYWPVASSPEDKGIRQSSLPAWVLLASLIISVYFDTIMHHNTIICRLTVSVLQLLSSFLFLDVSRRNVVCIVSGYRLDHRAIEVRSPAEAKGFFF